MCTVKKRKKRRCDKAVGVAAAVTRRRRRPRTLVSLEGQGLVVPELSRRGGDDPGWHTDLEIMKKKQEEGKKNETGWE